jgi:hypothetical protein
MTWVSSKICVIFPLAASGNPLQRIPVISLALEPVVPICNIPNEFAIAALL